MGVEINDTNDQVTPRIDVESGNITSDEKELLLKKREDEMNTDQSSEENEEADHTLLTTITEGVEGVMEGVAEGVHGVIDGVQGVVEGVQEVVEGFHDAMMEEMHDAKDILMEELHDNDNGDTYFFEMGLTRGMSLLPEDLPEAVKEVTGQKIDMTQYESKDEHIPVSAYLLLASAVVSLSALGVCMDLFKDVSPGMKLYWRQFGTAMVMFPFACRSVHKHGFPQLSLSNWCTFFMGTVCYVVMCLGFVVALDYTSVGNAVIFNNSQALLLLAGRALVGESIKILEGSGALVAFLGGMMCSKDSAGSEITEDKSQMLSYLGDFISMVSALGGVGYIIFAKSIRSNMPVIVFMFLNMFFGAQIVLIYMAIVGEKFDFSTNVDYGLFGWMHWRYDRLPLEITTVLVCNVIGSMGYIKAMKYFDNLIISVATLMEPVAASALAVIMGVGMLPGMLGIFGNILVGVGTFLVVYQPKGGKSDLH